MKFYIQALLIAVTSSVLANTFSKRDECEDQINDIKDNCMIKEITKDNYKEACEKLKTEKCQHFFIDPFSVAKACIGNPSAVDESFDDKSVNEVKKAYKLSCSIDGDGKECPVNSVYLNKSTEYNNNLVKDSCPSKTCSDALNEYIDNILADGPNETLENMKKELNDKDCVSQNKDDEDNFNNNNKVSGSTRLTAKIGGSLLLTLLLSYIFF